MLERVNRATNLPSFYGNTTLLLSIERLVVGLKGMRNCRASGCEIVEHRDAKPAEMEVGWMMEKEKLVVMEKEKTCLV